MRKLTDEDKRDVFNMWLNGDSYRKILEEKDISVGSTNRIIDDVRRQSPDIDLLRKLHVRLKKSGFTTYDALRACQLLEYLNNYGISASELQHYINLSQRSLADKNLQDNVMTYAVKLMELEQKYQKPYETVTEDFNKLVEETEARKAENAELKEKNEGLEKQAKNKTETNRQLDAQSVKISNEIAKLTTTYKQLRDFGPEKLQKLANFVHDIDALDFKIEEIQKLTILRRELMRMGFDPDNLEKDALRSNSLRIEANELESKVASLNNTTNQLAKTHTALLAAQRILQTNMIDIPCKVCKQIAARVPLPTKQQYNNVTPYGGFTPFVCPHCGSQQSFTMPEIAVQVAWTLFP